MALGHPSPATRCVEELKTTGAEMGNREEAETESGGQGAAVSALEAPLVSPASPSWKTSPGASPSIPFPVWAPPRIRRRVEPKFGIPRVLSWGPCL